MMSQTQIIETRSLRSGPQSELIAGNEFLKLFLERDQFHSASDYQSGGGDGSQVSQKSVAEEIGKPASSNRNNNARSLDYKGRHHDNNEHVVNNDKQQQQVVKLVTSGSKIVFLEEYDDADDAVVDAVARDIDLQREQKPYLRNKNNYNPQYNDNNNRHKAPTNSKQRYAGTDGDEIKLVGVSISSSSKRGSSATLPSTVNATTVTATKSIREQQNDNYPHHKNNKYIYKYNDKPTNKPSTSSSSTNKSLKTALTTTKTTERTITTAFPKRRDIASTWRPQSSLPYATNSEFINLSHKSELSIEETEPLTMTQQQQQQQKQRQRGKKSRMTTLDTINDSENSASTNIQNVLAPPLLNAPTDDSTINKMNMSGNDNENDESITTIGVEEEKKLLPFQTVIYHDTRNNDGSSEGHEPQSRSISYSSLSQNVEDLHTWQSTGSILAEAQRNVSESLKPSPKVAKSTDTSNSGAKFYSVPAKMYGEASKFYGEPAKVYSEPAKVYGEPEKIYSEPAKIYSEPSKFYSEPAKVYSQPAKVYGEPSKTYWPTETSTTTTGAPNNKYIPPSRRPNIVSRIAFGEGTQMSSSTITTTTTTGQTTSSTVKPPSNSGGYRNHHSHYTSTRQHSQAHQQAHQQSQQQQQQHLVGTNINNQPRRVLFNLDRLPYDLLNAPEQPLSQLPSEQPNLTDLSHGPISCFESELPLTASATSNSAASTSTAQTAVSSLTVTHQPQQQQLLLIQQRQQQQQHLSSSDQQQHSNQNAKGLPNRGEHLVI